MWQPSNIENNADVKSGSEYVGHREGNEEGKLTEQNRSAEVPIDGH